MRVLIILTTLLGLNLSFAATVASTLLAEALQNLETHYYGYSQVDFKALGERYRAELEQACAGQQECGAGVAQRVIGNLVRGIGDGHTYFMNPERYKQVLEEFSSTPTARPLYGFTPLTFAEGKVLIGDIRSQSAAEKAGLLAFDRIEAVDGKALTGIEDFRAKINTDQTVTFSLLRGNERLNISLKREMYGLPELPTLYVPQGVHSGVFVLRITDFAVYKQVGPKVHELVNQAIAKNAKAIIVDLRNNSGGEETECESAPGAFVGNFALEMRTKTAKVAFGYRDGTVLGNDPKDPNPIYSINQPARFTGKVAVLMNRSTASCGELMAYVMKEFGKVPLIGERTRGVMNTATEFWPLADGSAIAITYVRTFTTSGAALPEFVEPDIQMSFDIEAIARTGQDAMLDKAIEVLGLGK